jgi:hypothetical protein
MRDMIVPQTTMIKGTDANKIGYALCIMAKRERARTPSRWAKDPEKDIAVNRISAEYVGWREGHTKVPLLGNTVSEGRTSAI